MAFCLNTNAALILYTELTNNEFFVDKSGIIKHFNKRIGTNSKFICITKPRRFGKTSVLNMLGAYYCKAYDSKSLFDTLEISRADTYEQHLNQYHVINLCLSALSDKSDTYDDYIELFKNSIRRDIYKTYPHLATEYYYSISELLTATNERFIFIIDEWDYIFSHELYTKHHGDFLEFLRDLLKDKPYVEFVYMTGVLPIKKYSTGSALNMFKEYTMLKDPFFEEYFGFTEDEVKALCDKQSALTMDEIRDWYNGYQTRSGVQLYNPRSVICALEDETCQSYWTRTGKMDEVLFFLKYNIGEVRDDVVKMVNHLPVKIEILDEYTAGQEAPSNREEIYAAMIIYGLLSYHDGELRIPNRELMLEFQKALKDDDFGQVAELVRNSEKILTATLEQREDVVVSYLHNVHNSEIPVLQYNDENSLSCVAYLSARNKYRIEREEKSGKGFADFIFYPRRQELPGIVIELKVDITPEAAVEQIVEREYCQKLGNQRNRDILLVGISYNTKKKEHQCRIEKVHGF